MKKRGQAEIFGLIIIVILLIFALLFFVKTRQDDSSNLTIRSNLRANNLLNAIMNYHVGDDNMKELLKECVKTGDPTSPKCVGTNGVETKLIGIFDSEVLLEVENYEFKGSKGDLNDPVNPIIHLPASPCDTGITASPFRLPGRYTFELKLCFRE
ncbi:MAG: hypothetical protein CMH62_00885 [Nanoarchaeota archaeon]|nr:hypothetical protein [Nanoarchaeota archaeon]